MSQSNSYLQIALLPVPLANKESYIEHASLMAGIFREHGAEISVESWGVDLPEGKLTDFRKAVAAKEDETVVVAMMRWPSKEASETAMAALKADTRMADMAMPFDANRMIFGGFEELNLGLYQEPM